MKYGPNTPAIERLLEQARGMTPEQVDRVASALDVHGVGRTSAWAHGRVVVRNDIRLGAALDTALDAARDITHSLAARAVSWDAILALVVRDLISKEHFDVLYGPWASVFGEPK